MFAEVELLNCNAVSVRYTAENLTNQHRCHRSLLNCDWFLSWGIFLISLWHNHGYETRNFHLRFGWKMLMPKALRSILPCFLLACCLHPQWGHEVQHCDDVWWKTGFHLGSNASWGLMKGFFWVYFWMRTELNPSTFQSTALWKSIHSNSLCLVKWWHVYLSSSCCMMTQSSLTLSWDISNEYLMCTSECLLSVWQSLGPLTWAHNCATETLGWS